LNLFIFAAVFSIFSSYNTCPLLSAGELPPGITPNLTSWDSTVIKLSIHILYTLKRSEINQAQTKKKCGWTLVFHGLIKDATSAMDKSA
jgi:hypothetical protein